jgi:hypothetical protein
MNLKHVARSGTWFRSGDLQLGQRARTFAWFNNCNH